MKTLTFMLAWLLSLSSNATTLRNQPLDQAVSKADRVVMLRIVEAKLLKVKNINKKSYILNNCGINVIAEVVDNFKGIKQNRVQFSTMEHIHVGSLYFAILNKLDSRKWLSDQFSGIVIEGIQLGNSPEEVTCLEQVHHLKALAFPQRLMKYDGNNWLDISLNNIVFPNNVIKKVESEQSVISQYNQIKVDYSLLKKYLIHKNQSIDSYK